MKKTFLFSILEGRWKGKDWLYILHISLYSTNSSKLSFGFSGALPSLLIYCSYFYLLVGRRSIILLVPTSANCEHQLSDKSQSGHCIVQLHRSMSSVIYIFSSILESLPFPDCRVCFHLVFSIGYRAYSV